MSAVTQRDRITARQIAYIQRRLEMPKFVSEEERKLNSRLVRVVEQARRIADLPGPPEEIDSYSHLTKDEASDLCDALLRNHQGAEESNNVCVLCGRGNRGLLGDCCSACGTYVAEAIGKDGDFSKPIRHVTHISPIVRHFGRTCYLCGEVPSEHAEHVVPRVEGGSDTWANLGGACASCNLQKQDDVIELTDDQKRRLTEQQAAVQAAFDAILADQTMFWISWLEDEINDAVEDLKDDYLDDPDYVDEEVVTDYLGIDLLRQQDYPLMPEEVLKVACAEVLRRLAALE